ncbi:MAG: SGNH/GDSL hydrolase family protein [Candidatus Hodarchaeota archaeon]
MEKKLSLFFIAIFILISEVYAMEPPKHVVLLGASVGRSWHIEDLPARIGIQNYRFEYVSEYQFDKTEALQRILQRSGNKSDAIFIKACAAYFPRDQVQYQAQMKTWVELCKGARVIPILTTVVPVIKGGSLQLRAKETIKWLLGKPTLESRLDGLLQYNDWIRSFAKKEGLAVLDLEAALRTNEEDRSLRIDLHSGDGLHLNKKAYDLLDRIVLPTLEHAFRKNLRNK